MLKYWRYRYRAAPNRSSRRPPCRVDRVELWTKTPAATSGIRDFDIQVRDGDTWRTVAQVGGNTEEHVVTRFPAERTDAVRVLIHFAGGNYSRLVELEAYGPQ
ncbi:hypothetical protein GCM10010246_06390 [Streptomyces cuspidosporus]|uniref:F5/8 type C domain-containing protein n=1 Tax=Streptomyces cuspidosporus TaxID=66882 RepID=A0ABP5SCA5_9ACTN